MCVRQMLIRTQLGQTFSVDGCGAGFMAKNVATGLLLANSELPDYDSNLSQRSRKVIALDTQRHGQWGTGLSDS